MVCPICDYPQLTPKYRLRDRFFATVEDEFILYSCRSCGLLCQDEEPVRDRLADFYPAGYWWRPAGGGRLSRLEKSYRRWVLQRDQLRFLRSAVPEPGGVRLLDVGCGGGSFLQAALEAGFDAYGLEQSPEACRIAEREAPGRVIQGSESELAAQGESYDVVTLFHALEHLPQPFKYLKGLQKLLRKPGTLLVQVPNAQSIQARLTGRRWYGLDCPRHLYNYNPYALMHLLGRAGFRVHRLRHFSLRDNAAALASSLLPFLDPMSQRVRLLRRTGRLHSAGLALREAAYLPTLVLCQPLAWLEAQAGRGGSIAAYCTWEDKI